MSLELGQVAVGAINDGQYTHISAVVDQQPVLLGASRNCVTILHEDFSILASLPFELAFPLHSTLTSTIQAVAFDRTSGRIAAASDERIGVWEPTASSSWRVHSSFTAPHSVSSLDFAKDTIVAGGDALSLWTLDETHALSRWIKSGTELESSPVLTARLSPSAQILASVQAGSNLVRISSILPPTTAPPGNSLRFRSHAAHSLRLRDVSWRPTDDPADSGPILFTATVDGIFRIWGCMIDEPDFFSLWATLDVHASLPKHVPLATCFKATRDMWPAKEGEPTRRGTKDDFVTVFSDGTVHLTTVANFDCRPPTCLSQTTIVLQEQVFQQTQLANLRYPTLLITSPTTATLVGRCSRGTLLTLSTRLDDPTDKTSHFVHPPRTVPVNLTGKIRHLVPTFCGEAMLVLGDNGRIQSWELGEGDVMTESFVSDPQIKSSSRIATWHDGRMVATATPDGLKVFEFRQSGHLRLVDHLSDVLPPLATMFVARTEEDSLSTTIIAITSDFITLTWTFSSALRKISEGSTQSLNEARSPTCPLAVAVGVPIRSSESKVEQAEILVVDIAGTISFWKARIPDSSYTWEEGAELKTGKEGVVMAACNSSLMSALVTLNGDEYELSIWDSKSSEFASGLQFSQKMSDEVIDLDWSVSGDTLAVSTPSHVDLLCAQRLDDLSDSPSWITYASIRDYQMTSAPISCACWLSRGLAIASGNSLFFYSSKLLPSKEDCHDFASSRVAPLPYHHPQLLFQALLHGHTDVVLKILESLAAQLTENGDVTPIRNSRADDKITVEDFLRAQTAKAKVTENSNDFFSALTSGNKQDSSSQTASLTEEGTHRLLAALKKCPLRGLSKIEHAHLAVVVQTAFEIQRQKGSLDSNGLRYLISMRSFFIYNATTLPSATPQTALQRLKYRDVVWAFHSDSQDLLLDESIKACEGSKLTWDNAKALGVFLWLKSPEVLSRQLEVVGRTEYVRPDREDKDPIIATLFYLALRKKHIVRTFWKQAGGHSDQRSMLKFLANDFELPRWRSAALKNAFALLSKQRFLFAAAFFLLGDSLKDAVSVCLRQLDDFQLAIAITRVHEGDDGPVLKMILEDNVLPFAFKSGFRWLASWSFWMLGKRDLAVQAIVTPLNELASRLPYNLITVGSPMHEDPCLVLLFEQLRSWSLQTVKGAVAVPGRTEFNFVLHMSRVLCRMGCHLLALSLLRNYEFTRPEPVTPASSRPSFNPRERMGLRRMSTIMDMEVPSRLASRAPSPVRETVGGQEFHQVLKRVKVEKVQEFDMSAFNF